MRTQHGRWFVRLLCLCTLWLLDERIGIAAEADWSSDLIHQEDVVYSRIGDRELRLDLTYLAPEQEIARPVVVWIHGGAWRGGNKRPNPMIWLADHGYIVASVEYRFSQEAIWPAQIQDCITAVRYLRANAERYGIDPARMGVIGASAGGHLAAMLGTAGDEESLAGEREWGEASSRVQAVVDIFGPSDILRLNEFPSVFDHDAPDSPGSLLIGGPIQENPERVRAANPITYISGDEPPFLILHGDEDDVVPLHQSELLQEALSQAGVSSELVVVKGGGHGRWDESTEPTQADIDERIVQFFDAHLK